MFLANSRVHTVADGAVEIVDLFFRGSNPLLNRLLIPAVDALPTLDLFPYQTFQLFQAF